MSYKRSIKTEEKILNVINSMNLRDLSILVREFEKEMLPDRKEPYHPEAEISAGLESFLEWVENKKNNNIKDL